MHYQEVYLLVQVGHVHSMHAVESAQVRIWILLDMSVVMRKNSSQKLALLLAHSLNHVFSIMWKEEKIALELPAFAIAFEFDVVVDSSNASCILLVVDSKQPSKMMEHLGCIRLQSWTKEAKKMQN